MDLNTRNYEYKQTLTTQQNWGQIEKTIHDALMTTYHHKENANRKDTDWVNKQKIRSTPQEQQTMEYMITKRRNLQTRLEQLKRTTHQFNKIALRKCIYSSKNTYGKKTTKIDT